MKKGRKRPRDENDLHWLGEGVSGQGSLFAELDPYIYRADAEICQLAKSMRFERSSDREKMRILLCPPADAIGWQLAELTDYGLVWVQHQQPDDFQEEVAEVFNVLPFEDEASVSFEASLDLIIHTDHNWDSLAAFREGVRAAKPLLSGDGRALFLLPGRIGPRDAAIVWPNGEETDLERLQNGEIFLMPTPHTSKVLPFADIQAGEDEYLRRFLKRHRRYFGKAALGACLERMRDPDFVALLAGEGSSLRCALLLTFGSDGMIFEKGV